jgi:hypothetical protein
MVGSGQLHASASLSPKKEPRYRLNTRLGARKRQVGRFGGWEDPLPVPGFDPDSAIISTNGLCAEPQLRGSITATACAIHSHTVFVFYRPLTAGARINRQISTEMFQLASL